MNENSAVGVKFLPDYDGDVADDHEVKTISENVKVHLSGLYDSNVMKFIKLSIIIENKII